MGIKEPENPIQVGDTGPTAKTFTLDRRGCGGETHTLGHIPSGQQAKDIGAVINIPGPGGIQHSGLKDGLVMQARTVITDTTPGAQGDDGMARSQFQQAR